MGDPSCFTSDDGDGSPGAASVPHVMGTSSVGFSVLGFLGFLCFCARIPSSMGHSVVAPFPFMIGRSIINCCTEKDNSVVTSALSISVTWKSRPNSSVVISALYC